MEDYIGLEAEFFGQMMLASKITSETCTELKHDMTHELGTQIYPIQK
jgi:hypothetical protein